MSHSCNCNNDNGHNCEHENNYYIYGYGNVGHFCESDGTIVGIIFVIIGIILLLV